MNCAVEGCERDSWARGWCLMHYKRWWKHGDAHLDGRSKRKRDLIDRIADKFLVGDHCWPWIASLDMGGYGQINAGGAKTMMLAAHRVVYEMLKGPIPEGMVIDHLCRNRACVRPDHMEVVTHRTNILRGTGQSARNAKKTHCKNGHEFTPENTYSGISRNGNPYRHCRTCTLAYQKVRYRAAHPSS